MTAPARKQFESLPATIIIHRDGGDEVWIASDLAWDVGFDIPYVLTSTSFSEERWFPASDLSEIAPQMWTGEIWTEGGSGPRFTVRPTVDSDAVSSITMNGFPRVPMPLAVIAAIHASNGAFTMPTLLAMSDDSGFVVTMMLSTGEGLFVRYSGAWHRLTDDDAVDGLTVNEVDAAALDMFDQFDRAGQLVAVTAMPVNGVQRPEPVTPAQTPAADRTSAKEVPIIASVRDVQAAIDQAADDPQMQWYIERRIRALGIEVDLPWE